ncbi:helix-turn-helix domain-containing protein [Rhizobium sp. BR 315]|uniref:helix-turn-helix domain-containing protein n=1 Tax=Rhizobium sp. BR 315 TaxID=3040014 RepID=UPI003D337AB4
MHDTSKKKLPNHIDIEVGKRIRAQRRLLNLSQSQLAERLKVTFQQVQKYEKGSNRVSASRLQGIADSLGVPISHFFINIAPNGPDSLNEASTIENNLIVFVSSEEGVELNRAFKTIKDARMRRKIVDLIKTLALT